MESRLNGRFRQEISAEPVGIPLGQWPTGGQAAIISARQGAGYLEISHVVKIRLKRMGRPHRPFYRISVVDARVKRDGDVIEILGWYDPCSQDKTKQHEINAERVKFWLARGAQPSETIMDMLVRTEVVEGSEWKKRQSWRIEARKTGAANRAAAGAQKKDPKAKA